MKMLKVFVFLIGISCCTAINAQQKDLIVQMSAYLTSNGTMAQYQDAYGELLKLMEKQFPKSDNNANGWKYLERNQKKALDEIRDLLIPVYLRHFDEKDVLEMQAFYDSESGKQLIKDHNLLSDAQRKDVDAFYASRVGLKIKDKQMELTEEIAAVSEYWSKDIYQTAVLLLTE